MADCWECIHMNSQRCEGRTDGYTDGDSWVYFDEPTHFEPKAESEDEYNG